jgi:hydroxyacylglutathione hydrolase
MQIITARGGIASTNAFLIGDEISGKAVLFDAPDHTVVPLLDEAKKRNWDLIGLWLTHGHFDHIADHALVTQAFPNSKVLIHRLDEPKMVIPQSKFIPLPFDIPSRHADAYLEDNQELMIGPIKVRVIHMPGHAPGHVMFHLPDHDVLVGGDLIIMGAIGRTDLPDADFEQLAESVRRVMKLPDKTRLLPGHGDISTLGDERESNEYVRQILSHG